MPKIACIGSVTVDLFLHADTPIESLSTTQGTTDYFLIPVGEKLPLYESFRFCGGGAANTAIGFQKLGIEAQVWSSRGDDDNGNFIAQTLNKAHVDTAGLRTIPQTESSFSVIVMGTDGRRSVLHERISSPEPFSLSQLPNDLDGVYLGHLKGKEAETLTLLPDWLQKHPQTKLFWNPGQTQFAAGYKTLQPLLAITEALILNREELEALTTTQIPRKSIHALSCQSLTDRPALTPVANPQSATQQIFETGTQTIFMTDGHYGAHALQSTRWLYQPAGPQKPQNTLGAGDAFSVGAVAANILTQDLDTQLLWGTKNAEATIQQFGAQEGQLHYQQIKNS